MRTIAAVLLTASLGVGTTFAQTTTRITVTPQGLQDHAHWQIWGVSDDARILLLQRFGSTTPSPFGAGNVHLFDRPSGAMTPLVFAPNTAPIFWLSMSGDARFIAFITNADGIVAGDVNGGSDAFVYDRSSGVITRESLTPGGAEFPSPQEPASIRLSADGRFAVFNVNAPFDTILQAVAWYLRDRVSGTTVSLDGVDGPVHTDQLHRNYRSSADGRYLAYSEFAPSPGAYILDRTTGQRTPISVTPSGEVRPASVHGFSDDAQTVLSTSAAADLVAGDTNGRSDFFLFTRGTGELVRINPGADEANLIPETGGPTLSRNGRFVAYSRIAGTKYRLYLYDHLTRENFVIAADTDAQFGGVSNDGRFVAFGSLASTIDPADTNYLVDAYLHDRQGNPRCAVRVGEPRIRSVTSGGGTGFIDVAGLSSACVWTATSNEAWLRIISASGGSGTQPTHVIYEYGFTTPQDGFARTGAITVNDKTVLVRQAGVVTRGPWGTIDMPAGDGSVLSGAIPVTGWALDDVDVVRVRVTRDPAGAETPGQELFVADAVQVEGARPDVVSIHSALYPYDLRAGWGLQVLSNMLPGQGNGTFRLHADAFDREGNRSRLGSRTVVVDNANAAIPFGTLDTPRQGETVSDTIVNFGWALTPQPASIATDRSTLDVVVDGVVVGHPVYNHFRSDIAALFPAYANTNGAVGYFMLDTRTLANGLHTIAWVVRDSLGRATGIGSRFFTVSNP